MGQPPVGITLQISGPQIPCSNFAAADAAPLHLIVSRCIVPEYTHKDRQVIESEGMAWALLEGVRLLEDGLNDTAFHLAAVAVKEALLQLARDLREYNDGFEVDE